MELKKTIEKFATIYIINTNPFWFSFNYLKQTTEQRLKQKAPLIIAMNQGMKQTRRQVSYPDLSTRCQASST